MRPGFNRYDDARFVQKPQSLKPPEANDAWGAWIEYRVCRLESDQTWLMRVLVGALLLQVGLQVLGIVR